MSSFEGLRKGTFFLTMRTETILLGGCQRCCWKLKPSVLFGEIEKGGQAAFWVLVVYRVHLVCLV